jgi:hypothetical protein
MCSGMARPADPLNELDALEQHIRQLEVERRALLAEQILLERQNIVPTAPKPGTTPQERTQKYMNGFSSLALVENRPRGERLHELIRDYEAVGVAIDTLERRRIALDGKRVEAQAEAFTPQWLQTVIDIILLAEKLRHKEAKAASVPQDVRMRLPLAEFVGARSVVGVNWSSDPLGELRRAALKAGVITQRDIAEAKS